MLGWIFFIASCYIVTFIAKCIYKGVNMILHLIMKELGKLRQPVPVPKKGEDPNVC